MAEEASDSKVRAGTSSTGGLAHSNEYLRLLVGSVTDYAIFSVALLPKLQGMTERIGRELHAAGTTVFVRVPLSLP